MTALQLFHTSKIWKSYLTPISYQKSQLWLFLLMVLKMKPPVSPNHWELQYSCSSIWALMFIFMQQTPQDFLPLIPESVVWPLYLVCWLASFCNMTYLAHIWMQVSMTRVLELEDWYNVDFYQQIFMWWSSLPKP